MIINKTQLGENWPFTVDEVEVEYHINQWDMPWSIIIYNGNKYALTGQAEQLGYLSLGSASIWADEYWLSGTKKSLTPLFEFLEGK